MPLEMETSDFKTFVAWSLAKGFLQQCAKVSQRIFFSLKKHRVLAVFFPERILTSQHLGVSGLQRPKNPQNDSCFVGGKHGVICF